MNLNPAFRTTHIVRPRQGSQSQRGVVLIIALIVLVSMTLAAIGMSRSIDTANLVAGNMAFKQATLQGGDTGFKNAFAWLAANSAGTTLQNTDTTNGYYSSVPVTEPTWFDPGDAIWGNAVVLNGGVPDNAGNVVRYVVHRLCTQPDTAYNDQNAGVANQCAMTFAGGSATQGASMAVGATQFQGVPQLYYRVTTRVDGPRSTVSIMQMTVQLQV
jgi:Tfp pilus assembly protein PilX